jgi:hypothetical protein
MGRASTRPPPDLAQYLLFLYRKPKIRASRRMKTIRVFYEKMVYDFLVVASVMT